MPSYRELCQEMKREGLVSKRRDCKTKKNVSRKKRQLLKIADAKGYTLERDEPFEIEIPKVDIPELRRSLARRQQLLGSIIAPTERPRPVPSRSSIEQLDIGTTEQLELQEVAEEKAEELEREQQRRSVA